jgi:Uma2 family endonuclease
MSGVQTQTIRKKRYDRSAPPLAACEIVLQDQQQIRVPTGAFTLEGFRQWALSDQFPQRGRISFLGQEILIDMSPEEYQTHGQVKVEVGRVIPNLNVQLQLGKFFPDRTLLINKAANLSTEPDAAFATWDTLESGRARLVPRLQEGEEYWELQGAPDWVLEIVSKSSVVKDTRLLRAQYHQAGITEYWLIDARGEEIDFQILLHQPSGYVRAPRRRGWQQSRVFGHSFRLERRRGRLGLWEYTLHARPIR